MRLGAHDFAGNGKLSHDTTMERIGWRVTPAAYLGGGGRGGVARTVVWPQPESNYFPHFPPGQRLFSSQTYSKIPICSHSGFRVMVKSCDQAAVKVFGSSIVS